MSISPNILKEIELENTILYEGAVEILKGSGNRLTALAECLVYELQCAFVSHSGSLNISFFIELSYDYRLGAGPVQSGSYRLSVSRSFDLGMPIGEAGLPARYHFLPVISTPQYAYTLSNDRKSLHLKLCTDIRVYFTEHYFTSLYRCRPGTMAMKSGLSEDRHEMGFQQDQWEKQPSKEQPSEQPPKNQAAEQPTEYQEGAQPPGIQAADQLTAHQAAAQPQTGRAEMQSCEVFGRNAEKAPSPVADEYYHALIASQNARIRRLEEELSNRGVIIDKLLRLSHIL